VPDEPEDPLGRVRLPAIARSPFWELTRRLLLAIAILAATVLVVYVDRHGYIDNSDPLHGVDLIDSIYYATVTLSTTGYGDIVPYAPHTRLINAFLITPLRISISAPCITTGRNMRWRRSITAAPLMSILGTLWPTSIWAMCWTKPGG